MITGIDVSHWNGVIDWNAVGETDHEFAFIKCSEHSSFVDDKFALNWAASKGKLLRGPYHFWRAAYDAKDQARHFYDTFFGLAERIELPPVLDVEDTWATDDNLGPSVKECLDWIEEFFDVRPIIYTGAWWWNPWVGAQSWADDYLIWAANYTTASSPRLPAGWTSWDFWQYTSSGRCPGISGNVDLNRYSGSLVDLRALAGDVQNPPPAPGSLDEVWQAIRELEHWCDVINDEVTEIQNALRKPILEE